MKILQHYFTSILLSICTLLCMLPAPASAQLFGGMIKSGKNVPPVVPIGIPANITLATNQKYFVASVYDTDYLPYTAPAGLATTAAQAANGVAEAVTVNVQGAITTTGVPVSLAVTATGSGTMPAYTTTITIPAAMTEDGIARDLTLSWASQSYTSATTNIAATLKSVGGTLNAKKLDINAGIGSDYLGVLLGQLVYPYNTAGTTTTYSVRGMPGIPDRMFGLADNGGVVRHNFLYLPVMGEDGKVWLNNNLGADYANTNSTSFNPAQQATALTDYHAYGSLFQWGRKPDGHELITWSATFVGAASGTTATLSDNPLHALFISHSNGNQDWRSTPSVTLWSGVNSANNPCPVGYRVPTSAEWLAYWTAVNAHKSWPEATVMTYNIKISYCGIRGTMGTISSSTGRVAHLWSTDWNVNVGVLEAEMSLHSCVMGYAKLISSMPRVAAAGVRCVGN